MSIFSSLNNLDLGMLLAILSVLIFGGGFIFLILPKEELSRAIENLGKIKKEENR